jgi:hypothetical protein
LERDTMMRSLAWGEAILSNVAEVHPIPIGEVLASPYCRTRETAEPAFGRAYVVERKFMSATDGRGGFAHFATIVPGDWPRLVSLSHR